MQAHMHGIQRERESARASRVTCMHLRSQRKHAALDKPLTPHFPKNHPTSQSRWLKLAGWTGWDGSSWKTHPSAWVCEEVSGTKLVVPADKKAWHPVSQTCHLL